MSRCHPSSAHRRASTLLACAALVTAACSGNDVVPPPPPPPPLGGPGGGPVDPLVDLQGLPANVPRPPTAPGSGVASNFGTVTLAAGFNPDPHVVEGTSGGQVRADAKSSECKGWIAEDPDHVLIAATEFSLMRLVVSAGEADTTLVVQRPDGVFLCDDDGGGSRQPLVSGAFAPGTYRIWVGTFEPQTASPYRLGFSELPNTTAATLGAPGPAVAASGEASFGTTELAPGFMPDPHVVQGQSGGTVNASTLGPDCGGWISPRPDHLFIAREPFEQLHIVVRSDVDTTLILRRPDGGYVCDDDSGGDRNPTLVADLDAGTYQIWVGSYEQEQNANYDLGFSGRVGTTPSDLRSAE